MSDTAGAARQTPEPAFVHPTADVEPGCHLEEGVRVWHHCHVRTGARLGAGTQLGKGVFVDVGVSVGRAVKVQNNVSLYRGLTVEDEVFIGPSAVFTNDRNPRAGGDWRQEATLLRTGCSIGGGATVLPGLVIGEFALVGAGAVVTHDVAPHQLVVGNPARPSGWVCRCGDVVSRGADRPSVLRCPNHEEEQA